VWARRRRGNGRGIDGRCVQAGSASCGHQSVAPESTRAPQPVSRPTPSAPAPPRPRPSTTAKAISPIGPVDRGRQPGVRRVRAGGRRETPLRETPARRVAGAHARAHVGHATGGAHQLNAAQPPGTIRWRRRAPRQRRRVGTTTRPSRPPTPAVGQPVGRRAAGQPIAARRACVSWKISDRPPAQRAGEAAFSPNRGTNIPRAASMRPATAPDMAGQGSARSRRNARAPCGGWRAPDRRPSSWKIHFRMVDLQAGDEHVAMKTARSRRCRG